MARRYDVVLLDFLMPVLDGIACVTEYRAWEREELCARARCSVFSHRGKLTLKTTLISNRVRKGGWCFGCENEAF